MDYLFGWMFLTGFLAFLLPLIIGIAWIIIIIAILIRQEDYVCRAELKEDAKWMIQGKKGVLFLCDLVAGLLCIVPILNIIIGPALRLGITRIYLGVTEDRKPRVGDVFSGFDLFGRSWVLSFLVGLFTFLWSLIPVAGIWLGIQKRLSYSMSMYILAENPDMRASEALEESKRIMHGRKMDLFALELSFIGWNLLGVITFGISNLVFTNYYYQTAYANFYNAVKNQDVHGAGGYRPVNNRPYRANGYSNARGKQPNVSEKLIVGTAGMYSGAIIPLPIDEELIFGRDAALCHVVIIKGAEKISRKHLSVYLDDENGSFVVTDFSSNGTYLADGTRLIPNIATKLIPGTVIYLANKNNSFRLG